MGILFHTAPRLFIRRSTPYRSQWSSLIRKQHKASSAENISSQRSLKEEDKPAPLVAKISPRRSIWQHVSPRVIAKSYARAQEKRPYTTQICSTITIWCCGDLLAQRIEGEGYNPWKTLRNIVIGCSAAIPNYKWYRIMRRLGYILCSLADRFMYLGQSFNYSSKFKSLAAKVIVNQALFSPAFNTYFFGMQSLLSGDSVEDATERIKNTVPTSVINAWKVWPAVTAFNFTYIPPESRALFAGWSNYYQMVPANGDTGFVAIGWQSYLLWLNQRAADKEQAQKLLEAAEP